MNKTYTTLRLTSLIFMSLFILSACQSTKVSRVDSDVEMALTDKWNDKDSQLVAKAMIEDMMSFPWIDKHLKKEGTNPVIIINRVRNKSHEHIAVDTFLNDLKRSILRSGRADFVANSELRQDIRAERADQELNASVDSQNEMGEELGADYALSGSINSMVDQLDGKRVTAYQVDLQLIDMTTNREVWNGQKKIKKYQERSSFGL
jgi:penicillin-binding protein activator|tara:strand:- start:1310 stop:1924 length:615 start_codon:yes stop_codon:yes gene_type:complete